VRGQHRANPARRSPWAVLNSPQCHRCPPCPDRSSAKVRGCDVIGNTIAGVSVP